MKDLLKNRIFLIILSSDLLDQVSIWIRNIAILYFVIEQTNQNPIAISAITVLEFLPMFLFSFIGGTFADRWNPKKTIISGGLLSIASILLIIASVSLGYWQAVFFATFVSAIVSQFSQPSSSKIFKRHIPEEQVSTALGLSQSLTSIFVIIGPIIGTTVYTQFGILPSLYLLIFTFGLSTIITVFLPKDASLVSETKNTVLTEIKEGFKYVWNNNNLRRICYIFFFIGIAGGLLQPLEVFLVTDRLQLPKEALQWLTSISGLGMLVGGIIAAIIAEKISGRAVFVFTLLFMSISTILEVWSTRFALTASLTFLGSFFVAFIQIKLSTLMITYVEEAFIGRTNGIITPVMLGAMLIGNALSGVIMQNTSLFIVYFIAACFMALASIPSLGLTFTQNKQTTNEELIS
ncbi:MFS transporter [Bacillus massiliigorillae]|uniref:MFS transporter n=1 Tax=Bacillus massiliigorillae TaxID=1243664 RepID=UPI0003A4CF1A|nr:MFS transporter [Bacillus massiliigorillae]